MSWRSLIFSFGETSFSFIFCFFNFNDIREVNFSKYKKFVISVSKFAASSLVATVVDVLLFTYVFTEFLTVFQSELLAGFIGMCINFILQKKYVFQKKTEIFKSQFLIIFLLMHLFLVNVLFLFYI